MNKDADNCIDLLRKIMLYQYKRSPSAHEYLKNEGAIHVDPFERMMQTGHPDSLDAVCNIYEMFRAILKSLPEGMGLLPPMPHT